MRLEGKVALITGATGGMGSASARLFATEGAAVLVAARHQDQGDALVKEMTDAGGKAIFVHLDSTEYGQWDDAVRRAKKEFGALHVLMNVVGTNDLTVIPDTDPAEWNRIFEINVTATMVGIQACAPLMKESGGGSIINIGSVGGLTGAPGGAYSASKWALEGLSRQRRLGHGGSVPERRPTPPHAPDPPDKGSRQGEEGGRGGVFPATRVAAGRRPSAEASSGRLRGV
jgi:NAD(P)-dependent dehydrogenase (short-subunit alcohol dehydrogenase family)